MEVHTDSGELRLALARCKMLSNAVGTVNPRPPGLHNDLVQLVKRLLARLLAWYARPQRELNLSVVRSLDILASAIEKLQTNSQAVDERLLQLKLDNTVLTSSLRKGMELLVKLESLADSHKNDGLETALASMEGHASNPQEAPCVRLCDFDELRSAVATIERPRNAMGTVTPRPSGWYNDLIQRVEKLLARLLAWYTRPLYDFNDAVNRSLEEIACAVGNLSTVMVVLDGRLAEAENRSATLAESMQELLLLLHEQVEALVSIRESANLVALAGRMETDWDKRAREISEFYIDTGLGNDRTTYVIGLFGTGRLYVNELIRQKIGGRAAYFSDAIRFHRGPTSMIYSGHATMRHVCSGQALPAVMTRILEAVRSGFANLIFVYRHPLDSLLTNWVWWRAYIHNNRGNSGISHVYGNTDNLCADLEQNFSEFKIFAEGNPEFFAAKPGTRFLSFPEFVEETELHLQSATLALRLEDFMIDPLKEFSKIVDVMSVDLDLSSLRITPPRTQPYRYLAVKEKVLPFRDFINGLNAETKRRIEKIGYSVSAL